MCIGLGDEKNVSKAPTFDINTLNVYRSLNYSLSTSLHLVLHRMLPPLLMRDGSVDDRESSAWHTGFRLGLDVLVRI